MNKLMMIAMLTAACGGKAKPADTTPDTTGPAGSGVGGDGAEPANVNDTSSMFAPEVMDQIQRALDRKRDSVARCLGIAVDNKELPKSAHGKVVLEIVIATTGSASSVKVLKTDLESKTLTDCVIHHVQEIQFPQVPKPYERSYTYGFEAM